LTAGVAFCTNTNDLLVVFDLHKSVIGVDVSDLIQSLEFFVDEPESTDELLVENLDTFDQAQVKIHNFLDVNLSIILVISLYSIAQTKIEVTSLFIICRD
jgi:hypothetical protein